MVSTSDKFLESYSENFSISRCVKLRKSRNKISGIKCVTFNIHGLSSFIDEVEMHIKSISNDMSGIILKLHNQVKMPLQNVIGYNVNRYKKYSLTSCCIPYFKINIFGYTMVKESMNNPEFNKCDICQSRMLLKNK